MANYPPKIVTVGTSAVQLLVAKAARKQYKIIFPSSTKIAANTGLVYIGIGFTPVAIAGSTAQGHIMSNGEEYAEKVTAGLDPITGKAYDDCSKDAIYAISDTAGQKLEVYEVV